MHEDCALRQVVVISHNVRDEAELLPADILDQMHVANGYRARALLLVDGSQSHIRVAPRNILFETRETTSTFRWSPLRPERRPSSAQRHSWLDPS